MKSTFTVLRTIVYATVFFSFFTWLTLLLRSFDRSLGVCLPAGAAVPGILLMGAGGILGITCIVLFVSRGKGTPAPFDAPKEFVVTGPYRYVRNPMYLGGLLLLAGAGLYLHSPSVLLLSLVVALIVHLFVVFYEEPTLRTKFGTSFESYCAEVRRWIPRPSAR